MSSAAKFYASLALVGAALLSLDDRLALGYAVLGILCLTVIQLSVIIESGNYRSFVVNAVSDRIEGSRRFYALSGFSMIAGPFLGVLFKLAWLNYAL